MAHPLQDGRAKLLGVVQMMRSKTRGCRPDGCGRMLAARCRWYGFRAFVAMAVTAIMVWPVGLAYGVVIQELPGSQLLWGKSYPDTDYADLLFYTNYGSSRYEALGRMLAGEGGSSAWPVLTDDQRAYLSNPGTGGAFYTLAQELHSFDDINDVADALEVPTPIYWWVVNVGLYLVDTGEWQNALYLNNLWYMDCTQQQIDDALDSVEDVLSGNIPGGGGGGGGNDNEQYTTFKGNVHFYDLSSKSLDYVTIGGRQYTANKYRIDNSGRYQLPETLSVRVNTSTLSQLDTSDMSKYFITVRLSSGSIYLTIFESYTGNVSYQNNTIYNNLPYISSIEPTLYTYTVYGSVSGSNITLDGSTLTLNTGVFTYSQNTEEGYKINSSTMYERNVFLYDNGGGSEPVVPPTNWPDPTPTPTPPSSPVVPVAPTINNNNTYIDNTYNTTNVDTSGDVTALLQKILQALDTHCVHLQNTIADELEINAKWITDTIDADVEILMDYLQELFDWLKENMDFEFEMAPYDDSSLLY